MSLLLKENKMKCKKDNVELIGYTATDYPFESGFKCPRCGREWSDLQLNRSKYWCYSEKVKIGADGILWENI